VIEQPEKSTLAAFATPQDVLNNLDLGRIKDSVSDEHEKRIDSAVEESFYVFPRSAGLYTVYSVNKGTVESKYSVNLHYGTSGCSCSDYLIRCTGQGLSCKHMWRVRLLMKINCLPKKDHIPYAWIINELYKDRMWIRENISEPNGKINQISRLINKITFKGKSDINYEEAMKKRGRIMMNVSLLE
jgi:hypothetical protein